MQFDRELLASLALDSVGANSIEWLDSPFNPADRTRDGEWKSIDFLADHGGEAWKRYWPDKKPGHANRDGVPSWDAVGLLHSNAKKEWLLVEAKAHEGEFASLSGKCGAGERSRRWIRDTLRDTFLDCSGDAEEWPKVEAFWLGRGYQLANRLTTLRFLNQHGQPARLLYIYFVGDTYKICPRDAKRWRAVIANAYRQMGLPELHLLSNRIHYVFPNVRTFENACSPHNL